ncbi:MAG TPA: hypothetical protein PLU67_02620 [Candidatus Kapabacteria bacterium]|nr:hypothetical protein [Candidatus Kapabacteria bacterium]
MRSNNQPPQLQNALQPLHTTSSFQTSPQPFAPEPAQSAMYQPAFSILPKANAPEICILHSKCLPLPPYPFVPQTAASAPHYPAQMQPVLAVSPLPPAFAQFAPAQLCPAPLDAPPTAAPTAPSALPAYPACPSARCKTHSQAIPLPPTAQATAVISIFLLFSSTTSFFSSDDFEPSNEFISVSPILPS